ncbi:unnamed protein product [Alopecurus aequalis]
MAFHNQLLRCNVCKYPDFICVEFSLDEVNILTILGDYKTRMVIPCKFGDHLTRLFRSKFKVEMEPTHEIFEFDIWKDRKKYYVEGHWEMFVSIYNIKQGDELCFHLRPIFTGGHIRRLSGGFALPRCTKAEYEAEQELRDMEECTSSVDTH